MTYFKYSFAHLWLSTAYELFGFYMVKAMVIIMIT